ncbi:YcxB family protein [Phyllobacterium myrsinacearum]|uniref:YcxB-like C-terminal domain-containing protein n=1 Tax=Phyllobacterium myrsinacearum TaxID=28101 RepID=A0A839EV86_9HYPH|nr:YcxB family protein [Phyllobacterium myrsinacearum]MBA8882068.1 hypothetical protein [Phyllobacterium myrsinacearum]
MQEAELVWTEVKYTKQDFIRAQQLHSAPRIRDWVVLLLIGIPTGLFALDDHRKSIWLLIPAGMILVGAVMRWIYTPWFASRNYNMQPLAHVVLSFAFDPDCLWSRSERGESKLLWKDFIRWRSNDTSVLLYMSPSMFLVIPARIGASGFPIAELKHALDNNVGPAVR